MKINHGDIVEFLAMSWDNTNWEFDYPSVLIKPVLQYSPNGTSPDYLIEEAVINLSCGDELEDEEDFNEDLEWNGTNLTTLKRVVKERMQGKNTWKTKIREINYQKIEFFWNKDEGSFNFKILESKTF